MEQVEESAEETAAEVMIEVYTSVLRPIGAGVARSWRWAGVNPAKLLVALLGTAGWGALALVYAVAALVVPLTYALLLTITAPVVIGALFQRHRAGGHLGG